MSWIESIKHDIATIPQTDRDLKKFGLTVGSVLVLLSMLAWWLNWWSVPFIGGVSGTGIVCMLLGLMFPASLKRVQKIWMGLAFVIGSIVSRFILCIIYYFIVTPIAIAARIFGKKFLEESGKDEHGSYWIRRSPKQAAHYERMS